MTRAGSAVPPGQRHTGGGRPRSACVLALGAALLVACGTQSDVAAYSQASQCETNPDSQDCVMPDLGVDASVGIPDTGPPRDSTCPASPPRGECPGLDGIMCGYEQLACGCFAGLWWCAESFRLPDRWPGSDRDGSSGGTAGTGGMGGIGGSSGQIDPCPPFKPPQDSACFPGITLECTYGGDLCRCHSGQWRC